MEFFDKLRITLSSPLKSHGSDSRDFKTWTVQAQGFKEENVRLLLYRDCDRRGRKCLFDSAHITKDAAGKFTYIPVTNTGQVKDLSEWIFGCVPLSSSSTKRFHRWKGNLIWSHTFQTPAPASRHKITCKNVYSSSSSCLSSNGDLTSSGYTSGSGIDDSSYDQSSTDSLRNWSLPAMNPAGTNDLKMSHSLPSKFEIPTTKIILGLAIVISTGDDDTDDPHSNREGYDRKQVGTYISCTSNILEMSTDWFAAVALQGLTNPQMFVETLYKFSEDYRQFFMSRLTAPLVNISCMSLTTKQIPTSLGEFLTAYMTHDISWVKNKAVPKRCKVVIIGAPKRVQDVKSVFTLMKLINQCLCWRTLSMTNLPTQTSSATVCSDTAVLEVHAKQSKAVSIPEKRAEISPTKDEIGLDVVALNPEDFTRRIEDSKMLTRDSTQDSGIYSVISSCTSLKRSSTSSKFLNNLPPSTDSLDGKVDSNFGVCFHLGEESDTEQTFNTLGLSEPNPDKLKQHVSCFSNDNDKYDSKISPSLSDEPHEDTDAPEECSTSNNGTPLKIELNVNTPTRLTKFCDYCDSVSIVEKFNPLYQMQWLKCSPAATNNSQSHEPVLGEVFNLVDEDWLLYNIDKNCIKYFDASSKQETVFQSPASTLVTNMLEHVQVLSNNSRESEIEEFVSMQLDFIKKLGEDFGRRLMDVTKLDMNSMPYVSENDLGLLFSVAGWKYPALRHRFFV